MRVGVDFITFDASASTTSSSLDGVFLIVVHSGEPHRSKLDGVAFTCSEATGDVVVVVRRCVVVGWRRRFQACFTSPYCYMRISDQGCAVCLLCCCCSRQAQAKASTFSGGLREIFLFGDIDDDVLSERGFKVGVILVSKDTAE